MPYNGKEYETMVRVARLEDLGEKLRDVQLSGTMLWFLGHIRSGDQINLDALASEVAMQVQGCNEALDLLYKVISDYDGNYCPKCGSCGVSECCSAPHCAYFDQYKGSLGDDLKEALRDARYYRDRAYALHQLLERIHGWDMMDCAADGPFWRREITKALKYD